MDHQFGPDVLGYISWNRGFKSGGFNPTLVTQPPYKPERLDDYEIGEKSTLLDGRLRLNAAFFYYIYKDIQVNTFLNSVAVIYNGAEAREYGLDASFDATPTTPRPRIRDRPRVIVCPSPLTPPPAWASTTSM